jgi:hypothetical protein
MDSGALSWTCTTVIAEHKQHSCSVAVCSLAAWHRQDLVKGHSDACHGVCVQVEHVPWIGYMRPNMTIQVVDHFMAHTVGGVPPQVDTAVAGPGQQTGSALLLFISTLACLGGHSPVLVSLYLLDWGLDAVQGHEPQQLLPDHLL